MFIKRHSILALQYCPASIRGTGVLGARKLQRPYTRRITLKVGWGMRATVKASQMKKALPSFGRQCLLNLVGAKGFEPSTPCSQSRCATKLRHAPQECAVANAGAESVGETNCCLPSRRGVCPDMPTICLKVVPIKAHFLRGTIALSV